ncbi:hypothetical protein [Nocardia terpenica]|uniref:Thioredoxin domain-containing protein n=1 Tax=Nocardia terpenica TaxID=455432 RepID=A0A6G9YZW5_9NOCA|nr:hypothetical protein [Nocardia terpenica]QIS18657.1 hypothetical protein F6W96_10505 [Nocardia terpenica]
MVFLIAAVVLVGAVCALDLLLTLGVVKRLREHTALLAARMPVLGAPNIETGMEIGEFATVTVDGSPLIPESLRTGTLVGFFTPDCRPCQEMLPKFVEYAKAVPGGRDRVLAVVVGNAGEAGDMVADLIPVARVVTEGDGGELTRAFRMVYFPSALTVAPNGNGRLTVTTDRVELDQPPVPA